MTVNDILILVRQRLGDMQKVTFSDAELIHCLNDAMDELCTSMSEDYDPEILKEVALTENGIKLPDDFIAWQGQYPLLYKTDDSNVTKIYPLDSEWDGENATMKYFAYKPHFTALEDTIPFRTGVQQKRLMKLCVQQIKGDGNSDSQGASRPSGGSE